MVSGIFNRSVEKINKKHNHKIFSVPGDGDRRSSSASKKG